MVFKANDRVRISDDSTEYYGEYKNCYGTVRNYYPFERYGIAVELDNIENWQSVYGVFYFKPEHVDHAVQPCTLDPRVLHKPGNIALPAIKNVIFNAPATIVFWADGTKTVVKCGANDQFDPEKGLAMAACKKMWGTSKTGGNYYDEFKKWLRDL